MIKFIKRLFFFCFFSIMIGSAWGYYHGLNSDNYQAFIADKITEFSKNIEDWISDFDQEEIASEKPVKKKKSKSKNGLQPLPKNLFEKIDRHARNCPTIAETDIISLADYLQIETNTDLEKARSIYVWLTDNITYDDQAYNSGIYDDYSAENVLKNKTAVCAGFSNLYFALGKEMNLEIHKVSGYAKGYGYEPRVKFDRTDHAWNAIKIDGKWRVFDATWGEGNGRNVNGKLVSEKEFDDYWFDVDPYEAIFNHLPENAAFSFVQPPLSLYEYELFPNISSAYFKLGFDGKETYEEAQLNNDIEFPICYNLKTYVELNSAPKYAILYTDEVYNFELYIPRGLKVAAIDSNHEWTHFKRENGIFKLEYIPQVEGDLKISVKYDKGGRSYHSIMKYTVKIKGEII